MSDELTNTRKRIVHTEDRAELDLEYYRRGFINGYNWGAEAGIEVAGWGRFEVTYGECYEQEHDWKDEEEMSGKKISDFLKLSYQIGYVDAYDRGFTDNLNSLQAAWETNAKQQGLEFDDDDDQHGELFM